MGKSVEQRFGSRELLAEELKLAVDFLIFFEHGGGLFDAGSAEGMLL